MRTYRVHILFVILLSGIFITPDALAQKRLKGKHKKMYAAANELLKQKEYHSAYDTYTRLYMVDSTFMELNLKLGLCLLHMPGKQLKAIKYLEKARYAGLTEAYLNLGIAYHTVEKFDEAIKVFQYYKEKKDKLVDNDEVYRLTKISQEASSRMNSPENVTIKKLSSNINSDYDDYNPFVTAGDTTLFFTSNRHGNVGGKRDATGEFYGDIYYAIRSGYDWMPAKNIGEPVNSPEHDAVAGISPSGNAVVAYKTEEGWAKGQLYTSRETVGYWSDPEIMPTVINSASREDFGSYTGDGRLFYFASDRPGGLGGMDIYRCVKMGNGEWSLPQNLGASINTKYDEDAPFIHADGRTLYFSSDGHNTIGGADIFTATKDDNGFWSIPTNIGYPINTVKNDVQFSIDGTGEIGYIASTRDEAGGDLDIYSVEFLDISVKQTVIKGIIRDAETNQVLSARVTLVDLDTKTLQGIYQSNAKTGKYIMIVKPGENYEMIVELAGYQTQTEFLVFSADDNQFPIELEKKASK